MSTATKSLPSHDLFVIPESGRWIEVGAGWTNRDGSVSITLSQPVAKGARLQVRRRVYSAEALAAARIALIEDERRRQADNDKAPGADAHREESLTEPTPAPQYVEPTPPAARDACSGILVLA